MKRVRLTFGGGGFFFFFFLFCLNKAKNKPNVSVAENAEKKIWIKLYHNKYFYGTFNSNFSLQNKQLQQINKEKPKKRKKRENGELKFCHSMRLAPSFGPL